MLELNHTALSHTHGQRVREAKLGWEGKGRLPVTLVANEGADKGEAMFMTRERKDTEIQKIMRCICVERVIFLVLMVIKDNRAIQENFP